MERICDTPDPAMDDLNHYAYANCNPVVYNDPTGNFAELMEENPYGALNGTAVHGLFFSLVKASNINNDSDLKTNRKLGGHYFSRPDVVMNGSIWELKPITYKNNPTKSKEANKQMKDYIRDSTYGLNLPLVRGYSNRIGNFNIIDGMSIGYIIDSVSGDLLEVNLYTGTNKMDGMIYYTLKKAKHDEKIREFISSLNSSKKYFTHSQVNLILVAVTAIFAVDALAARVTGMFMMILNPNQLDQSHSSIASNNNRNNNDYQNNQTTKDTNSSRRGYIKPDPPAKPDKGKDEILTLRNT